MIQARRAPKVHEKAEASTESTESELNFTRASNVDGLRQLRLMATQVESPGPAAYMADKAS